MKIQTAFYWNTMDIELLPKIGLRVSIPNILNLRHKWQYREIHLSFRFLGLWLVMQINF